METEDKLLIYCIEDDDDIRELVVYALKSSGYEAEGFSKNSDFEKAMLEKTPELIMLDIMLPDKDGIAVLKDLRKSNKNIPVIILTAKGSEMDKVRGFEHGADDYVTKPFSVMELISRVKAVLRRSKPEEDEITEYNGIKIDISKRTVAIDGEEIQITYKEFELLSTLLKHMGSVLSREKLLNKIWDYSFEGETRTVDVHIGSLRHKLGDKGSYIKTIRNVGYKIE